MKKINSFVKKAANLNLDAYTEGEANFNANIPAVEEMAAKRAKICSTCKYKEDEPIDFLKVQDRIPTLTDSICGVCGCTLSYLTRQNIKKCKKNKW